MQCNAANTNSITDVKQRFGTNIYDSYLKCATTVTPPVRAGAQQHTQQSLAEFYVAAML
jgi:hypothetical protein